MKITLQMILIVLHRIFSRENALALLLCCVIIALIIVMTDSAPAWIYQGF